MINVNEVFGRVAEVLEIKTDTALAKSLGVSPQAITNARKRGTIPYDRVCAFAKEHTLSLDYLFMGVGNPSASTQGVDPDLLMYIGAYFEHEWKEARLPSLTRAERFYYISLIYNRALGLEPYPRSGNGVDEKLANNSQKEIDFFLHVFKQGIVDPAHPYDVIDEDDSNIDPSSVTTEGTQVSQVVSGNNNQTAGRDIVNKEDSKKK